MTEKENQKLSLRGKICLGVLIASITAMAFMLIGVTAEPCAHGPVPEGTPTPWTVICLNISGISAFVLFFASITASTLVLKKRTKAPSKKERVIAHWTSLMPFLLFLTLAGTPVFLCYRCDIRTGACDSNKRLLDHAKGVYAIKNELVTGDSITIQQASEYIAGGAPVCPEAGKYTMNPVDTSVTCSYAGH